ncbi:MAG TPA: hypothetical protein VFZ42_13740 [Chitinophagaceae bacterium]
MRSILSERNIVVVLFVMVLVTFSLAHEDTKKMEQIFQGVQSSSATVLIDLEVKGNQLQQDNNSAFLPAATKE